MKQMFLFKNIKPSSTSPYGGQLLVGRRKTKRPLNVKQPLHVVLRGDTSRCGSLVKKQIFIGMTLTKMAARFRVKIYEKAVVSNHLHLVLKFSKTEDYKNFVRAVTGILAKRFELRWLFRPFTRIIFWGRDFKRVCQYVHMNFLEAEGIINYQIRRQRKWPPAMNTNASDCV